MKKFEDYTIKEIKQQFKDGDYTIKELEQRIKDLETPKVWLPYERFWLDVDDECEEIGWTVHPEKESIPKLNEQEALELKLYLAQRAWKKEFDDVELDWTSNKVYKYNVYYNNHYNSYDVNVWVLNKPIMQVWFSTEEKAEQCLQWLKDSGVIE